MVLLCRQLCRSCSPVLTVNLSNLNHLNNEDLFETASHTYYRDVSNYGGWQLYQGLFREKNKFIPGIWRFCWESGNLGNFSGNMRYVRDIEQRFDITCCQTIYIQWYAPSVCAVFYVFWHLKTAELPMIWKDQSATFPTKIAWSSSAIDHVQSPADWHKNQPPPQALSFFSSWRRARNASDWSWTAGDHGKGTNCRLSPLSPFLLSFARTFSSRERRLGTRQHKNRTAGARHILSVHTRSHHSLVQGYFYAAC